MNMRKADTTTQAVGLIVLVVLGALLFYKVALQRPTPAVRPISQTTSGGQSSLSRTDANGISWALDQAGGILVVPEANAPKAGPPILVKTDVQKVGDREMSIGLILEGQAGEQYRPVVKKNGQAIAPPGLRIVNETGQVLAQDSFQYG